MNKKDDLIIDVNKLIKALHHCTDEGNTSCEGCPYYCTYDFCKVKRNSLLLIETLLAKEKPRVLSFDEINEYEVVWLETKNIEYSSEYSLFPWINTGDGMWYSPLMCSKETPSMRLVDEEDYNKISRCWNKKPTKEQRKKEKWIE